MRESWIGKGVKKGGRVQKKTFRKKTMGKSSSLKDQEEEDDLSEDIAT